MIAVPFPSAPSHFRAGVPTVVPSESVPYRLAGLPPAAAPSATSSSSTAASSSGASVSSQSSLESDAGGGSCGHVAAFLGVADEADKVDASRLELAVKLGIKLSGKESRGGRSRKVPASKCGECAVSLGRPFLCLECGSTHCSAAEGPDHAKIHSLTHGHDLSYDLRSGSIYCYPCGDYAYHPAVDHVKAKELGRVSDAVVVAGVPTKRSRYQLWKPTDILLDSYPRGLRNLGQTCYMSVILQAFLHNPFLRSYYLSDRHNRDLCTRSMEGDKPCLSCELDRLFSEVYALTSAPFGPTSFLYSMWQSSSELSGYAQQDAHEFLISALNLLHASTPGSKNSGCTCVVHSTFAGQLRSNVTCGQCGNVTTSSDPFLDLSLDLRPGAGKTAINGVETLAGCLRRFTSSEQLAPNQYACSKCLSTAGTASKQLSIKTLPPVLCIQLKRFEHNTGAHKIDTPVQFPLLLNMRPYTSSTVDKPSVPLDGLDHLFEYELSTVVNHEGATGNNGHYTSVCFADAFFTFDDEKVSRAALSTVLNSKSYLLFYVKRELASLIPTTTTTTTTTA